MPRKPTGTVTTEKLTDGTRAFRLRFRAYGSRERVTLHERPGCDCGCGGGWDERAARTELGNLQARVRAGVWRSGAPARVTATAAAPAEVPTFHEYASGWLARKQIGALGPAVSPATYDRLLSHLKRHLLPFFARYSLDDIDQAVCLAFKEHKLTESAEIAAARATGADLRHRNGRQITPLAPATLRKLIDTLAQILDDAIEDGHLATNPARGKRMRVTVPRPNRTFLEQDELAAILDAAQVLDNACKPPAPPATGAGTTAAKVAKLAAKGMRPTDIAARLHRSKATVTYHLRRMNITPAGDYLGRRALCMLLGYSGLRVSEACDLHIGQLRLHDPSGARLRIPDAKTPTGIRDVEISTDLVEALVEHIDQLRRAGHPAGPDAHVFQNTRGDKITRQRAAELVHQAATAATSTVTERGLPPLPNVTPHTLRRTYVSIALLASRMDIRWVMAQVGHADSKMTLDVYNQLQQREQRAHGAAFDAKIRDARDRTTPAATDADWDTNGTRTAPEAPATVPAEWSAEA